LHGHVVKKLGFQITGHNDTSLVKKLIK
jgi:hypothetical protein